MNRDHRPDPGINKYQFCEGRECIQTVPVLTCVARFNPYDPICVHNEEYMEREKQKLDDNARYNLR